MFAYYERNYTLLTKKCQPVRKIFLLYPKNRDDVLFVRGDGENLSGFLKQIAFCKKFTFALSFRVNIRPVCP